VGLTKFTLFETVYIILLRRNRTNEDKDVHHTYTYTYTYHHHHTIYIYIYIYMVCAYSVYAFCPICAWCNISTCTWAKLATFESQKEVVCTIYFKMLPVTELMNIRVLHLSGQPNPVLPQNKHDTTNHILEDYSTKCCLWVPHRASL